MAALRRLWGEGPVHLTASAASLAFCAAVLLQVLELSNALSVLVWLAGAVIAHDLVAFPLYAGLDRLAGSGLARGSRRRADPGAINYLRVPAALSGLALLMFFPLILRLESERYELITGLDPGVYLERWLWLTATLFAGSGLVWAVSRRAAARRAPGEGA